jgi:excinuclease UvrABC helicase subunit UvrB
MHVSTYQIHNVLNVYSKQLSQDKNAPKLKSGYKRNLADQINLSPEGKRRATIEKVAQDILSKISDYGAKNKRKIEEADQFQLKEKAHFETDHKKEAAFVFNVIDELNKKTTTALSVKDTDFLVNRLDQLAKEAIEKDADT